jgi:acid phosphatase
MQTSTEYQALGLQAYATAKAQLDRALKDRKWTAAPEQTGNFKKLPPAVILDLDETMLNNSPFQAAMVQAGKSFDPAVFHQWVSRASAAALAGSVDYARYADSRGVTVFYVTNRSFDQHEPTLRNLSAVGLPVKKPASAMGLPDTLITLGGASNWGNDKGPRRALIAKYYRVLQLFGDDLNDFLSVPNADPSKRQAAASAYASYWGSRWIILPNPVYGSWRSALNTAGVKGALPVLELEKSKLQPMPAAASASSN